MPKDQFVKFVKAKRARPTRTIGEAGTAVYGGFIENRETNANLTGTKKWITFSQALANCGIVAAGVRYFLNLAGKAGWRAVPPGGKEAEGQKYADLMEEFMHDMETPWARVIRRATMYKFHGFSIQEWTGKIRDDGIMGLLDVEPRPQPTIEQWDTDKHGKVKGVVQRSSHGGGEIYLPRKKIIYVVDDSLSDSPEGLGLLRHCAPHVERLMRYEAIESIGVETDLRGVPVARMPLAIIAKMVESGDLIQEDADAMKAVMEDFIQNHIRAADSGLLLDSLTYQTQDERGAPSQTPQWAVEILKNETSALPDVANAISRLTHTLARILGVEQLLLGSEKGSFALSRDKTHNFFLIVDSALLEIGSSCEKDIRDPLWALNGWPEELKPTLVPETIKFRDVDVITGALKDLGASNLHPQDPIHNFVRDLIGAPRTDETLTVDQAVERGQEEVTDDGSSNPGSGDE